MINLPATAALAYASPAVTPTAAGPTGAAVAACPRHNHADIIKAWANGATIERRKVGAAHQAGGRWHGDWMEVEGHECVYLLDGFEYRVRPKMTPDEMLAAQAAGCRFQARVIGDDGPGPWFSSTWSFDGSEHNMEYRIEPARYRVAIMRSPNGSVWADLVNNEQAAGAVERLDDFARWAGGWVYYTENGVQADSGGAQPAVTTGSSEHARG